MDEGGSLHLFLLNRMLLVSAHFSKTMVFKLYCTSEPPGGLMKTEISGPHSQSGFSPSYVGTKNLDF